MSQIGIMQGRLVPPVNDRIQAFPRDNWAEEFPRAALAGLACIEWVYDTFGTDVNPLNTAEGIEKMRTLATEHTSVRSLCADYFMKFPLLRASAAELDERLHKLGWLLGQCRQAGISRIVLPFVDHSAIRTEAELESVVEVLKRALPLAEVQDVELHLETSLPPDRLAQLLARLPHPLIKVNYDSGNSASLGYHPQDEFTAYGAWVGSVHIKDRKLGGGTVPLGTGDVEFSALFECLEQLSYAGDYILQVARGVPGDEVNWARQNLAFVRRYL